MKLGVGLQMQQTQKLLITPELRQAIAILQLPVTELEEHIEQELLENPVLEVEHKEEPDLEPKEELDDEPFDPAEWLDYLGDDEQGGFAAFRHEGAPPPEPVVAPVVTLHEHLLQQLRLVRFSPAERRIGEALIGNLDERGYLVVDTGEVAASLAYAEEQVLAVLKVVQGFEPMGVGARNLRECLRLQLDLLPGAHPLVAAIIDDHLDDLAAGRIVRIAEDLGVTPPEVQAAVDLIRMLDPKPGRHFGRPGDTRYVVPDVTVERAGTDYLVLVNEGPAPRIGISHFYRTMLNSPIDERARRFLESKIQSALWLMKALEQRRLTLYRVTEAIVRFQRGFLDHGSRAMVPLTLREVAAEVGLHESTVSRATAHKYVQTPQGLFPLKFFFSSGVENADGSGVAAEGVKRMISDLVAAEDATSPLSDQMLTDTLGQQGVRISRRTVAKYREEMGLPPSNKRKRYETPAP